jgi:hypothetical protein
MTITAKAKVALHQVDGYVWCDAHGEVHEAEPNVYTEDETGNERGNRCLAENWRPVFTTDSDLGQF